MASYDTAGVYEKPYDHTGELEERGRARFTPDFRDLKREGWQMVFVYGTLKTGCYNNHLFKGGYTLGRAQTCMGTYEVFCTGSYPVAIDRTTAGTLSGRINGELYYVPPLLMLDLDELEANGHMYRRKRSWFYALDQEKSGKNQSLIQSVQAWIYLGIPEFWENQGNLEIQRPKIIDTKKVIEWKP